MTEPLVPLRSLFRERRAFEAPTPAYRLLPFAFDRFDEDYLLTNLVGEWVVVSRDKLDAFVRHALPRQSNEYQTLKAKHFLVDDASDVAIDLLALKNWSRLARLRELTGLHMFVVTLRCDHGCPYCQVSRQGVAAGSFDMSWEHASAALECVFQSPSTQLKIEFQGGEPLLNFELVKRIVLRAEELNQAHKRDLQFVIASTLSLLTDEVITFARDHNVYFSTSLDGPADLHNGQRPRPGRDSYERAVAGIRRVQNDLGADRVSALMTTTARSLPRVRDIIDEYRALGLKSVFLRRLSPYGFAVKTHMLKRYDSRDWVRFYKEGVEHILALNRAGIAFREELTAIVLEKMFRPTGSGYVDLQNPAGIGTSAIVYNYDGSVYASDEGRMLAEMGDTTFRLGTLGEGDLKDFLTDSRLVEILDVAMQEASPQCHECAFAPFCGSDPVYHHASQRDVIGDKSRSDFCKMTTSVVGHVIRLLRVPESREILMGWI